MDMAISEQDAMIGESCRSIIGSGAARDAERIRSELRDAGMFDLDLGDPEGLSAAFAVAHAVGAANAPVDAAGELVRGALVEAAFAGAEAAVIGWRIPDGEVLRSAGAAADAAVLVLSGDGTWTEHAAASSVRPFAFDPSGAVELATVAPGRTSGRTVVDERLAMVHRLLSDAEMLGAAETMVARTIEYVSSRVQYGHPIGSFQAVQHRLVDNFVGLRAADVAVCYATSLAAARLDDRTRAWQRASHAYAAEACLALAKTCFQYHGGMSFTEDFWPHRWLRRITRHSMRDGTPDAHYLAAGRLLDGRRAIMAFTSF